ncbi:MAG: hypothetical protein JWM74_5886, partial [Myxococcaceae bacterium]|nr:hypothetical protein [Myxococcaceae bacterium]
ALAELDGEVTITKEAAKRAWSKSRKLAAPLELSWRHDDPQMGRGELQVALAYQNLRGSIESLADEGSGVIDPATAEKPNDLMRILAAFKPLDKAGYYTSACSSSTTSGGWENANDSGEAENGAVFWNGQSHDSSFDAEGDLERPLHLHWRGDKKVIAAALRAAGLKIAIPKSEDTTFIVKPSRGRRA